MNHPGLAQRVTEPSDGKQATQIFRLELALDPEFLGGVRGERHCPHPVELIDGECPVQRLPLPQDASSLTREGSLHDQRGGARPVQAQLHPHRGRDRILCDHLDSNVISLGSRRDDGVRIVSGHPHALATGQHQVPLIHVGAGLDGAVESLGKNTGAAQMPKLAGPHVPHFPQTGSRGTRLPVAARLPPSDFTCRHGAGRLFRSGQTEARRAAEQRPRRFETMETPAGQSILFFRRLPRRRSDDTAPALRFDRGPFRDLPKRPAQHAHLSVGALCGPFGPRRQRLGDWLSPIRSASVGHEYEKLR